MPEQKKSEEKKEKPSKLAAVLIRSKMNLKPDTRRALSQLNLNRKNACVVLDDTPGNRGVLKRAAGSVTWGEVNASTIKKVKKERASPRDGVFSMHPPKGGFERKGIKEPYNRGGALGYRGDAMNELLERMI